MSKGAHPPRVTVALDLIHFVKVDGEGDEQGVQETLMTWGGCKRDSEIARWHPVNNEVNLKKPIIGVVALL